MIFLWADQRSTQAHTAYCIGYQMKLHIYKYLAANTIMWPLMCYFLLLTEAVNRSGEFTAKPGACPTVDGLYPGLENCESDMDCPGWQKCCQGLDGSFCSDAAS